MWCRYLATQFVCPDRWRSVSNLRYQHTDPLIDVECPSSSTENFQQVYYWAHLTGSNWTSVWMNCPPKKSNLIRTHLTLLNQKRFSAACWMKAWKDSDSSGDGGEISSQIKKERAIREIRRLRSSLFSPENQNLKLPPANRNLTLLNMWEQVSSYVGQNVSESRHRKPLRLYFKVKLHILKALPGFKNTQYVHGRVF